MAKKIIAAGFLVFFGLSIASTALAQTAVINGISPSSGSRGQTVTVSAFGSDFTSTPSCNVTSSGTGVNYIATSCTFISSSSISFQLQVTNSADAGTRTLTITGAGIPGAGQEVNFTVAAGEGAPAAIPLTVRTGTEFLALIEGIVNWIFVFVMVFAVIFIVLAGLQFITAGGEPQQVTQARSKLLWAAVGIIVAVLARGAVVAIRNLIGA